MKKERRRLILCFLIIAASLFLFSCGIPTLIDLTEIGLSGGRDDTSNTVKIKVQGVSADLDLVSSGCPGLLLCYVTSDSSDVYTDSSYVTKKFSDTFRNKIYIADDSYLLTAGNEDQYSLYAFEKESGSRVSSPSYNLNLNSYISGHHIDIELPLSHISGRSYQLGAVTVYTSDTEKKYVHIFAAFTAEQGSFTNVYLSGLVYLGYIDTSITP